MSKWSRRHSTTSIDPTNRIHHSGCHGAWTEALREQHYNNLCEFDGRLVMAGEHASRIPAWMEGAVLSASDAVNRLHARVVAP